MNDHAPIVLLPSTIFEPPFCRFRFRHIERHSIPLWITELKGFISPRHCLEFVHQGNKVRQACIFRSDVLDLKLEKHRAVGTRLCAPLLPERHRFNRADCQNGTRHHDFCKDWRQPLRLDLCDHLVKSDHMFDVVGDDANGCEFHDCSQLHAAPKDADT